MGVYNQIYVDLNIKETPSFEDLLKVLEIVRSTSGEKNPEILLLQNLKDGESWEMAELNYYRQLSLYLPYWQMPAQSQNFSQED